MTTEAIRVADFLKANPEFLVQNPSILTSVHLPIPARTTGKKVAYLQDRQILSMREKVKTLEQRLAHITIAALENQVIVGKLMALAQALLTVHDERQLTALLIEQIKAQFSMPMIHLKLWSQCTTSNTAERKAINQMKTLYCGFADQAPSMTVFDSEPVKPRSVVLIPLRFGNHPNTVGVMGLGSLDKDRFAPTLETDFLKTLAEIVCAALSRLQETKS
jgi:uncharacterized protein YigA (DUF484 family)